MQTSRGRHAGNGGEDLPPYHGKGTKPMKKILIGLAVVIVLVAGAAVYFLTNLDSLVQQAVEKYGSEATRTEVALSKVDLSLKEGTAALNGFRMGNPEGFKTDQAMSFGTISVRLDTGSLGGDVIAIREVVIDGPDVNYERGAGGSNFDVIQRNVEAYVKAVGAGGRPEKSGNETEETGEAGKQLIIENLYVRKGQVSLSAGFLEGKRLTVPLPEIHMKDIGKKDNGATPAEVAALVLDEITGKAASAGAAGMASAAKAAKEAMAGAKKMIEGAGGDAGKMLEGAGGGGGKALEDAGDAVKGLFGK